MHRVSPTGSTLSTATRITDALDRRLLAWSAVWTLPALVAFGVLSAIIPTPILARPIAPEPFAIAVWLVSAPLMGIIIATYTTRPPATPPEPLGGSETESDRGTTLGTVGGILAFVAIGCPICNKIVLVLLGTTGALTVFAPLQPLIGAASLVLLVGTVAWRLRLRARGNACALPR
jgi:hypothetical protein